VSIFKRFAASATVLLGVLSVFGFLFAASASAAPCAYSDCVSVSIGSSTAVAGGTVQLSGTGFGPNDLVYIDLYSNPIRLGQTTTDSTGAYNVTVTLPMGVTGSHTIMLTDTRTGQQASVPISIGAVSPTLAPPTKNALAPTGPGTGAVSPTLAPANNGAISAGGGGSTGGLPFTGVAALSLGGVGLLLLVGGWSVLFAGRRQRPLDV
jgi:hypothetical protein